MRRFGKSAIEEPKETQLLDESGGVLRRDRYELADSLFLEDLS